MALQSCIYGSVADSNFMGIRTLTVVAKSQQISLYCFDGLLSSANHRTTTNDARLLSTWFVGDCTASDKRPIGVTCHRTSDLFSIFVTYANTTGAYCRILSYRDDSLESISLDSSIVPFKDKFSCNQLQNVTAMVIMQRSRRVIFVMHDDTLMISATLDDAIETDRTITSSNISSFNAFGTLAVPDLSHRSQLFALDCFKLPALSTSNKLYRSLKSDDTIVQDVFAIEIGRNVEIVILIQSKITGMKSFLWTQFSCLHAGTVCSLDDKSQTDEKRFAQARLKVLYEVNLLSENAIVEVPYPTTAHEDSDVCHESSNGAIFIAVYETIQIFSENGLLRKVSVNSNICGLSILHATKDLCIVLASTFPGDFLLCEIKMKESHLSKNAEAVVSRGHLSKNDFRDFSCIKLKLIVASGDPDQRPILPFCDNMVFIPRKTGSGTRSYHPRSSDQFPILFLGYHRIYGCQLLQSAETVDSCFKLSRMGATQEIAASGAIYADLGPFECASSGVLDRIANCRIITPICDNPGKPYGTPDAFIAVCGDGLQGIRRRKKRENKERERERGMDRCSDNNCQLKTKFESPCGTAPGCEEKVDALQADEEGETEGQEQGETECTNVLYRVHTGVTLVSEQEISLDLDQDQDQDQDQDRGSEKDTTDAVTVTEQSKLFSFSFYPALAPSPFKGENDVGPAAAAVVAVLISSRAASTSSLVVLQSTGTEEKSAAFNPAIIEHEETLAWLLLPHTLSRTPPCPASGSPSPTAAEYALQATSTSIAIVSLCPPKTHSQQQSQGEGSTVTEKFHALLQKSHLYATPAFQTFHTFPNSWLIESLKLEKNFLFLTVTNRGKHFIAVAKVVSTDSGRLPGVSLLDLTPSRPISAMAVYLRPLLEKDADFAKQREKRNRGTHDTHPEEILLIVSYWEKDEVENEKDNQHHQFDLITVSEQEESVFLTATKRILHGPLAASSPHQESVNRHLFAFHGSHLSGSIGDSCLCLLAVAGDGTVLTYWLDVQSDRVVEGAARGATLGGAGGQADSILGSDDSKYCNYVVLHSERFVCPCGSVRNVWTDPSSVLDSPLRLILVGSGADYIIQPAATQTIAAHHQYMHSSSAGDGCETTDNDAHARISKSHASHHDGQHEAWGGNISENGSSAVQGTFSAYPVSWSFERIARPPGTSMYLAPFTRPCMSARALRTNTPPVPCHANPSSSSADYLSCTAFVWIQRVRTRAEGATEVDPKNIALPSARSSDGPVQLALCVGYVRKGESPQVDVCTYVRSVVRTVLVTPDGSKCIIFSQGNKSSNQCSPQDGWLEVYDSTTLERLWSSANNAEIRSAVQSTISICPPFFPSFLSQFSILSSQWHSGSADPRSVVTFGHLFSVQEGDTFVSSTISPTSPSFSPAAPSAASAIAIWSISLPACSTGGAVGCYSQRLSHTIPHRDPLTLMGCCTVRGEIDCFCPLDDKLVSFTLSGKLTVSGWVAGDDDSEDSSESKTNKQSSRNISPGLNGARAVDRSEPLHLSTLCELQTDLEPFSVVEMLSSRSDTIIVSLATGGICIYYLLFDEIYIEDAEHDKSFDGPKGVGGKRDSLCRTYSLTRGHTFPLPHCLLTNIRIHQTPDSGVVRLFCADRMSQSLAIITLDIIVGTEYAKKQKKVEKLSLKLLSHGINSAVRGRGDTDAGQDGGPNSYLKCCVDDLFDIVLDDRNSSSSFTLLDRGCRVSYFSEGQLAHCSSVVSSRPN